MRWISLRCAPLVAVALIMVACGKPAPAPTSEPSGEGVLGSVDLPSTAAPTPSASPPDGGSGDEDCYTYDPQMLLRNYEAGVHMVRVDHGDEIIRVYGGPGDPIGTAAIAVATRFETVCYIGRGNSFDSPRYVFEYWLNPSGMVHPDEPADLFDECVDYEPSRLAVSPNPDGPGWVVRADGNVLQVFATQADAEAGLDVVAAQGQICYVLTRTPESVRADISFTINTGD